MFTHATRGDTAPAPTGWRPSLVLPALLTLLRALPARANEHTPTGVA